MRLGTCQSPPWLRLRGVAAWGAPLRQILSPDSMSRIVGPRAGQFRYFFASLLASALAASALGTSVGVFAVSFAASAAAGAVAGAEVIGAAGAAAGLASCLPQPASPNADRAAIMMVRFMV